ncbi:hypothetical protein [Demequina maris]|uniref:hypothetical protein n=1 Tax=Demequina maris TaxID=1638982 RepID=UPI0007850175|nr:hypothetical protein [Demequina maris]
MSGRRARRKRQEKPRPSRKLIAVAPDDRGDLKDRQLTSLIRAFAREGVLSQIKIWHHGYDDVKTILERIDDGGDDSDTNSATDADTDTEAKEKAERDAARARVKGRPESLDPRTFLVVQTALTELGEPGYIASVAHAIRFRLSKHAAKILDIHPDFYELADGRTFWDVKGTDEERTVAFTKSAEAIYERVHSAYERLSDLVEPYPGAASRSARKWSDVKALIDALDAEGVAMRKERLSWLLNALLRASLHRYSREERRFILKNWGGSLAIDGTAVPLNCPKGWGGLSKENKKKNPDWLHHPEAMAGWHIRTGNHAGFEDDGKTPVSPDQLKKADWAYEAHFAVMCGDEHHQRPIPRIALGMSFDIPAGRIGENSFTALESAFVVMNENHVSPGTIVADRAVLPGAQYDKFKQPARKMGFKFCHDFRKDQLGKYDAPHGIKQIQGRLYCPGTPDAMANAARNLRTRNERAAAKAGVAPEDLRDFEPDKTYDAQRARLANFELTVKEPTNKNGRTRVACPATTAGGGVDCPLRALFPDNKTRTQVTNPPAMPGEICTSHQAALSMHHTDTTGKYAMDYVLGSPEWRTMMGNRNDVEGYNKAIKKDGLGDGARRPYRGYAKQALSTAQHAFATNVRRIREFLTGHFRASQPTVDPEPTPPTTPGIQNIELDEDLSPPDQLAA